MDYKVAALLLVLAAVVSESAINNNEFVSYVLLLVKSPTIETPIGSLHGKV